MALLDFDIAVIGGGPGGSATAIFAAREGYSVCLFERHPFPRETLCGEFLSGEVIRTLCTLGLEDKFFSLEPSPITRITLCTDDGSRVSRTLGFPAYGMKRGRFDLMLLEGAISHGVTVFQPAEIRAVVQEEGYFVVRGTTATGAMEVRAQWVVGAYGRSSHLDKELQRGFAGRRSGLNGVKFHLPAATLEEAAPDEILMCVGPDTYCGINHVGGGEATVCFLERRTMHDDPPRARLRALTKHNPGFARIVTSRALEFIERAPIHGSGNIYFGPRSVVERGVLMVGDAAGVIAPLAGDGISMALQGAVLLAKILSNERSGVRGRKTVEARYQQEWHRLFRARMRNALRFQAVLLSTTGQCVTSILLRSFPSLLDLAVRRTRDRSVS